MWFAEVNFRWLSRPYGTDGAQIGRLGIAGTQVETGAAGTAYFEPGGVSFWGGNIAY